MFDFAWTEIALIGVVALVFIGPKDMPIAMKAVTGMIRKARRMAAEFQTYVDEMVKDANLDEVRTQINQICNFDIKGEIERAVDSDGSLKSTFASNPFETTTYIPPEPVPAAEPVAEFGPPEAPAEPLTPEPADPALLAIPAWVPPEIASPPVLPAFIPPNITRH